MKIAGKRLEDAIFGAIVAGIPATEARGENPIREAIRMTLEVCGYGEARKNEANPNVNVERLNIHNEVYWLLNEMGFNFKHTGTQMLMILLPEMVTSPREKYRVASTQIYPWVGERFGGKSQIAVGRDLLTAMQQATQYERMASNAGGTGVKNILNWLCEQLRQRM